MRSTGWKWWTKFGNELEIWYKIQTNISLSSRFRSFLKIPKNKCTLGAHTKPENVVVRFFPFPSEWGILGDEDGEKRKRPHFFGKGFQIGNGGEKVNGACYWIAMPLPRQQQLTTTPTLPMLQGMHLCFPRCNIPLKWIKGFSWLWLEYNLKFGNTIFF